VITGIGWSQFDQELAYLNTTITFFSELLSAPLISFDVVATRITNCIAGDPFEGKAGDVIGYDYFAFLGFYLNPGTYFVGIHNQMTAGASATGLAPTLMANTSGTPQTLQGGKRTWVRSRRGQWRPTRDPTSRFRFSAGPQWRCPSRARSRCFGVD
jgi:hypothetical protein